MKQKKIWIALVAIVGIVACTRELNTKLGGEFIPPIDGVNVKDTLINVFGKTWGSDTATIPIQEINILGNSGSSEFGKMQSSVNIQMQPVIDSFSFPVGKDSLQLDSVVVVLATAGIIYGDSTQNLAFRVYEIDPSANFGIKQNYPYHTDVNFAHAGELTYNNMARVISPLSVDDSVRNYLDTTVNQLRIRLADNFGNRLLKDYSINHEYQTDSTFRDAFKGFQIVPENMGNAMIPVILTSNNTKLAIYYKYQKRDGTGLDTAVTYFRPNTNSASSNYIKRDRSGSALNTVFPVGNIDSSDNYLYVETSPGLYSRLSIPALAEFPKSLLYKAELIMTQISNPGDVSEKYGTPPNIMITGYDSANKRRLNLTKDNPLTVDNYYNYVTSGSSLAALGSYPVKIPDVNMPGDSVYQYHLDITHQVQDVLTGKATNISFDIFAPAANDSIFDASLGRYIHLGTVSSNTGALVPLNYPGIGRIRFAGPANTTKKLQLHIVYSPLKN